MMQAWRRRLDQGLNIQPGEGPAVIAGLLLFYLLFTGYFMLRPVRETLGVAGGVENLQWLFTGTFIATLACLPLFGWLAPGCSAGISCLGLMVFFRQQPVAVRGTVSR